MQLCTARLCQQRAAMQQAAAVGPAAHGVAMGLLLGNQAPPLHPPLLRARQPQQQCQAASTVQTSAQTAGASQGMCWAHWAGGCEMLWMDSSANNVFDFFELPLYL